MYYQNYEDYMRSVLGYPIESQNTYETYQYSQIPYERTQMYSNSARYTDEVMNLYPEIYKIVNPMVCKICDANTKPITCELVDKMTDEIYMNLESQPEMNTIVNVRVSASSEVENKVEKMNRTQSSTTPSNSQQQIVSQKNAKMDNDKNESRAIEENRQRRPNNTLRDLIRILILNRLLGENFPNRPPRPRPPRPPMRPPFPRDDRYYDEYFKF